MPTQLFKLICTTTILLGWYSSGVSQEASSSALPNILTILVDDLGVGDLSSYGATDLKSPHLDRLIGNGVRFDNAYANCPVCSPTRASFFTGRYPELVGVPGVIRTHAENSWGYLSKDAVLLPRLLKPAGYTTALIGKWHLGLEKPNRPNDRGFEFFHGYLGDMMDDYYKHRRHGINYMRKNENEIDPQGHATDLFTDWACDFIASQKDSSKPFYLALCYNAPHTPIQPPAEWLAKVKQREPDISPQRAKLIALIEHMDAGIGKVLAALESSDQSKNTLVLFTSDNGGQLNVGGRNLPYRDGKQSMYEGGIRVAASATWPQKIKPGTRSTARITSMDFFATVCEAAKVPIKHQIEGRSFLKIATGEQKAMASRDLFFHRREGGNRYAGLTINAVIRDDWKLLQNSPFQPLELYNLKDDPAETTNLANKNRKKFNELSKALRIQVQRGGAVPWQPSKRRDFTNQ